MDEIDGTLLVGIMTALFIVAVLVLMAGISAGAGFLIAKMLAAVGLVSYSKILWLGISAIVFILLSLD